MHRQTLIVLLGVGAFAFLSLMVLAFFGCASVPSPSDQAAVASYEAQQLACVVEAGTKEQADQCRCAVHQKWGRGCANVGAVDGGAE